MALVPNRARISAITSMILAATGAPAARIEAGSNSFFAAFDQATLAAIYAIGATLGLAAHQAPEPAKRYRMRILALPLHDRAPFHTSRTNRY
jgi:hypothetical protein